MGVYLNPRNDAFLESVNSEIYIDKTKLISYTNGVLGTEQKFICISRPRRFGKSMTAKMLAAYYCKDCDSEALFCNLQIAKDETYQKHLNQYDVIFFNVQDFLSTVSDAEQLVEQIQTKLLRDMQKVYGDRIDFTTNSLLDVLQQIYADEGTAFVFIIDEWDCIFREKKNNIDVQTKYLDFLRMLLKDKAYVKLAYMTGILPIKKYGTHSALNMFNEYSMTEPKALAEYIGFTEDEVVTLCDKYKMDFDETKRWYDGYQLGKGLNIYNPKSVVDAMLEQEFHSYWSRTENYEALKIYIDMNFDGLKDAIVLMLGGERVQINPGTFNNDMTTFYTKDDVLTLLVHLGYLTYNIETKEVSIPNEEVRGEFYNAISTSKWDEVLKAIRESDELLQKTWEMDGDTVAERLDAVHMDLTSILSYNNENSLSCVISMAYYSARNDYTMIRELPTGKGFADIIFLPHKYSDKPAMIVELKWDQSAETALTQIKDKQYVNALEKYSGEILLVGINYDKESKKHQCVIEKQYK